MENLLDKLNQFFSPVIIGVFSAAIYYAVVTILKNIKELKYNEKERMVELEMMRRSYEEKLYKISDQLASSENRWRDVNHLILSSQKYSQSDQPKERLQLSPYLKNVGLVESDLEVEKKTVFVLTPFHDRYKLMFESISIALRDIGLSVLRGDEDYVKTDLLQHVIKQIARARLLIVNLDGRNPNVFYELGVAHALGKQTILVSSNLEEVPFDLKSYKLVVYDSNEDLKEKIKVAVSQALV